jgi:hypothetical protein
MGRVYQMTSTNDITWAQSPAETSFSSINMNYGDDGFASTEENQTDVTAKVAGIFSAMTCHIAANTLSTASTVFSFRKNGANGNLSITVPAATTGVFSDLTNSDTIADGDKYNVQIATASGGTGTLIMGGVGVVFKASNGHSVQYGAAIDSNPAYSASTVYYIGLAGDIGVTTVIANAEVTMGPAGVLKNLQAYVSVNGRTSTTTIGSGVNGAAGNQSLSIPASSTGLFEDNTNTDSIASGDKVCTYISTGAGTGSFGIRRINSVYTVNNGKTITMIAHTLLGYSKNSGQNSHAPLGGCIPPSIAVEAEVQCNTNFAFRATKLRIRVSTNTFTGSSTATLRKNGADTALSITVPSATTGIFSDTTNTVDFSGTDLVNYRWTGGTTGSGIVRYYQVDIEDLGASESSKIIFF